jgi:hypothetical protein
MKTIHGQPSWRIACDSVEAYVTQLGGHLAPVIFDRWGKKISPYSISPWLASETAPTLLPILKVLRGDFFCCPFGDSPTLYRGERHLSHGETANSRWHLESQDGSRLHLSLQTKIRHGRVDKYITLRDGHNALYCQHVISGMSGPMNFGHHPTLKFPDEPGSGIISMSKFVYGQVYPDYFARPEQHGYQALKPGAEFTSLKKVRQLDGGVADLTRYPARRGFEDLVLMVSDDKLPFAWTAATFPKQGYVWFSLKNPRVLRNSLFWISNGGLYSPPWNGRHTSVMGIEDVTSYFHRGVAGSAGKNPLTAKGYPTCVQLSPKEPFTVNYIMAVALIPKGFNRVASITADLKQGTVTLRADSGQKVTTPLDVSFVL